MYRGLCAKLVTLAACCPLLVACGEKSFPPVVEPPSQEGMDPFVLEYLAPHVAAAKAAPGDPELRGTLGLVYEANKLWELGRGAFVNAEALDPDRPEWSFHAAIMALTMGDSAEAALRIDDLCRRFPNFAAAHARRGVMLFEAEDLEGALGEFRVTAQLQPAWVEGPVSVAEMLIQLDRAGEALPWLDRAEAIDSTYARIRHVRGQALLELGRAEEAATELHAGLDSKQWSLQTGIAKRLNGYLAGYEAQNAKALDLMDREQYTRAIAIFERLLERRPGDAAVPNNLSVAYRAVNRQQDAARLLEASVVKNPTHFPTMINLSGCYWELKDYEGALRLANRAVELVPTNGRARYTKARSLINLKRLEEARVELEKSVSYDSSQVHVFALLAEIQMKLARYAEAEEQWATVLQKLPGNFVAQYNLVKCQARVGKRREAIDSYRKLQASAPNRSEVQALGRELGL